MEVGNLIGSEQSQKVQAASSTNLHGIHHCYGDTSPSAYTDGHIGVGVGAFDQLTQEWKHKCGSLMSWLCMWVQAESVVLLHYRPIQGSPEI